jgi:hypothetical protein
MFRAVTDELCRDMGRPITLKREGVADVEFLGVIRGVRPDDLVASAQQADVMVVMPAAQVPGRAPKKFDRIVANGRVFTLQFIRECYDGAELCAYKATARG